MKTRMHGLNVAAQIERLEQDVEALRVRLDELSEQVDQAQHRCDGQVFRLANRVAHLETAVPGGQVHNGS